MAVGLGRKMLYFGRILSVSFAAHDKLKADKFSVVHSHPMNSSKLTTFLLALICAMSFIDSSARAQLIVTNGDFQDLTGLTTDVPGAWYGGVPAGWSGVNGSFSVRDLSGDYVANLNVLSTTSPSFVALRQAVGTLSSAGIITLSLNVTDLTTFGFTMSMGIFNTQNSSDYASWIALALPPADITTTGIQTLSTAVAIDAGTPIGVAFWASTGAPGIDDVTVVPEPSTYALLVLGAAGTGAHLIRRRRR